MVSEAPATGAHHDWYVRRHRRRRDGGPLPRRPDLDAYWHNLRSGVESIERLTEDDLLAEGVDPELIGAPGYVPVAPVLEGIDLFDARFFGFTAREAALLDPQQRLSSWRARGTPWSTPGSTPPGAEPPRCSRAATCPPI